MEWRITEAKQRGDKHSPSKAIKNFPQLFRDVEEANLQKASCWCKERDEYLLSFNTGWWGGEKKSLTANQDGPGKKRTQMKAPAGQRPKLQAWVEWLHVEILEEFWRLKAIRVKFSPTLLLALARGILEWSVNPDFNSTTICPRNGNRIVYKLTLRWILTFQERFNIRICCQTVKLATSPAHESYVEITSPTSWVKFRGTLSLANWTRTWLRIWMKLTLL
jgi:hypothetical protein